MNDQAAIGSKLELRYADALGAYLKTGDEAALVRAYELGRQVMDSGGGVLELTAMHEAAFEVVVATRYRTLSLSVAVKRSFEFLGEGLAPFEMAQRGFREANLRLLNANEQLAKRSEELSAANDRLEVTNIVIERDRAVLAAVIASMTDGLVVADAGGRITAANDRAGELLGTGCAQLIGQDLTAV